jgi:lipoprotein-anchoring transpeptidase ErfK/SrfK
VYWAFGVVASGLLGWFWWQAVVKSGGSGQRTEGAGPKVEDAGLRAEDEAKVQGPQPTNQVAQSAERGPPPRAPVAGPAWQLPATNLVVSNRWAGVMAEYAALKATPGPLTNAVGPWTVPLAPEAAARAPEGFPRPVQDIFEAQVALERQGISPGSLDGRFGAQTRAGLRAFQQRPGLPMSGELDLATRGELQLRTPPCTAYAVNAGDLARLQPLSSTWLGKSQQSALEYESILELVAERGHAHPNLIRQLNPGVNWLSITPGLVLQIPDGACPVAGDKAAYATIRLAEKVLEGFDANARLAVHFPCSVAQRVEKRPVGALHVSVIISNPNYTFNPEIFPESAEGRQLKARLVLPPGPNNPVGVVWIGLDKPGYGIHGTPSPEQVGRTESHGCFRLANWNAEALARLVWVGMPVYVVK